MGWCVCLYEVDTFLWIRSEVRSLQSGITENKKGGTVKTRSEVVDSVVVFIGCVKKAGSKVIV
jgi:hypothetical protein